MYIYIYIYIYGCCPILPCFLTTLQSTKRHGVQAKRSHLYTITQKHKRTHFVVIVCCITALICGSLLSLFHVILNIIIVVASVLK